MSIKSAIKKTLKNPAYMVAVLGSKGRLKWMPNKLYLKLMYKGMLGKKLPLDNPQTMQEKLQWLKLHDKNPLHTTLVDKADVKNYVADLLGEEYVIPTLGVWDKFEDIDFDKLPDQFVLKCTHDSGGLVICKDKSKLDLEKARKKINKCLKRNYYYVGREWPYKNVKPRIIAEKYMVDSTVKELRDYKFYCFDGEVDCVMACFDRGTGDTKYYFFDRNWQLLRYNQRGKAAPEGFTIEKPENLEEMFTVAQKLCVGMVFSRIDLYSVDGKTYFGEITFFPNSGFDCKKLPEMDRRWGEKMDLSKIKTQVQSISK